MPPQAEEPRLEDYLGIIWKRKWTVISAVVLVTAVTMVFTLLQTPIYEASTMLHLKQRSRSSALELYGAAMPFSTQTEINTEIEILRSRTLMEKVVHDVGAERIRRVEFIATPMRQLRRTFSGSLAAAGDWFRSLMGADHAHGDTSTNAANPGTGNPGDEGSGNPPDPDSDDPDRSLHNLAGYVSNHITMDPVRDTRVIKITASSYSPALARDLANSLARAATERNISSHRQESSAALGFISEQAEVVGRDLTQTEEELKHFKETQGFMRLSTEADLKVQNLADLESQYEGVKIERGELQVRLTEIRSQLASLDKTWQSSQTISTNPVVQMLKNQLTELQVQRAQLLREFPQGAPEVAQIDSKIEEIEGRLREEVQTIVSSQTESVSPVYTNLYTKLVDYETQVNALLAKEQALGQLVEDYQEDVDRLPAQEIRLARLERKRRVNEELYTLLLKHRNEARIQAASEIGNIEVVDPAILPENPAKPRTAMNGGLALFSGLVFGVMLAFLGEYMDRTIKDEQELQQAIDLPILGTVPTLGSKAAHYGYSYSYGYGKHRHTRSKPPKGEPEQVELISATHPKSSIAEHFRVLQTNLSFSDIEEKLTTIVVTSSIPKEGKTSVATNLAITFAQAGEKTLLIDADLRNHSLHRLFAEKLSPGLTELVAQKTVTLEQVVHPADTIANLSLLTTGNLPPNPVEFLASTPFQDLIAELKDRFDRIIFDTPPSLLMADAAVLAAKADGTILVVGAGEVEDEILQRTVESLKRVQARMVGAVLNKLELSSGHYGRYKYYYHYYYSHYNEDAGKKKRRAKRDTTTV